jgi:hypothetical protein
VLGLQRIVRLMRIPDNDLGKPGEHPFKLQIDRVGTPEPDWARSVRPSPTPCGLPPGPSLPLTLTLLAHELGSLRTLPAGTCLKRSRTRTLQQELR